MRLISDVSLLWAPAYAEIFSMYWGFLRSFSRQRENSGDYFSYLFEFIILRQKSGDGRLFAQVAEVKGENDLRCI
ncbi:hypothetical protein KDW_34410 [Dictyobacter vulcani]|uniref:Uncharacterized protein n=1 Tax=Dictyobacter vulcani TaxID=2607529 RepID=A0A5J4KTA7_9CHLR|nr:hypothetical protein KDW_34410 [Dictyobacter vulcani]